MNKELRKAISDMNRFLNLKEKVKNRVNTGDEWDEYVETGHKMYSKKQFQNKRWRDLFYGGEQK